MNLSISTIDALVILLYMLGTVAIGVWVGRGQVSTRDYFLADKSLPWWALLLSIVATETSTVTFLSVPGITYRGGDLRFLQFALGIMLGRLLVVVLLMPGFFRGDLQTAYQLLAHRFGIRVRWLASALFLITRNLADGLRLYLTALVLAKVARLDMSTSIVILGVITIVYTMLGGMKSVVWTDCLQFAVYIGGGIWAFAVLLQRIPGGWNELYRFGQQQGSFQMWDLRWDSPDGITLGSGLLGGALLSLGTHGADQMMVQRYLGARNFREACVAVLGSGAVVFLQFLLFLLIGLGLARFYRDQPAQAIPQDEVFATFIIDHMHVGVVGLTLAAIFSAAMSTLSSSLNSSASAWINDFVFSNRQSTHEAQALSASRRATLVFGLIQIAVGCLAIQFAVNRSTVDLVLKIASFTMGPILGLFLLANFSPKCNEQSALWGFGCGIGLLCAVEMAVVYRWMWIHPFYYTALGAGATLLVGTILRPSVRRSTPVWPNGGGDR